MNKIVINCTRFKDTQNCVRYRASDNVAIVNDPYLKIEALLAAFGDIPEAIEITVVKKEPLA